MPPVLLLPAFHVRAPGRLGARPLRPAGAALWLWRSERAFAFCSQANPPQQPRRRQALPASCPSRSPPRPREQFRHFPLKRLWSRAFLNRRVLQNADSLRKVFLITLGNIAAALPVPAHAAAFLLPQCLPTRIFRPGLFSKFRPAPQTAVSELGKLSGTLYSSLRRTNVHQSVFSSLPLALSSDPPSLFLVIEDYV